MYYTLRQIKTRELFWENIKEFELYLLIVPMLGITMIDTDEEAVQEYKYTYAVKHISGYRIAKWIEKIIQKDILIGR